MTMPPANSPDSQPIRTEEQNIRLGSAASRDLSSLIALICQTVTGPWLEKHLTQRREGQGLHLGCGKGEETLLIASLLGAKGSLLGIDDDEVMIETARQKQVLSGLERVYFAQASLSNWSTADPQDFIYTRIQTVAAPEPERRLADLHRNLNTGGILLVEVIDLSGFRMYPYNHAFARAMELIGRLEDGQPYTPDQLAGFLEKAGFLNVETTYAAPAFIPRTCNHIASLALECYREKILRRGDSNRAELNALLQELRAYEQQSDILITRPGVLQIISKKNKPSQ